MFYLDTLKFTSKKINSELLYNFPNAYFCQRVQFLVGIKNLTELLFYSDKYSPYCNGMSLLAGTKSVHGKRETDVKKRIFLAKLYARLDRGLFSFNTKPKISLISCGKVPMNSSAWVLGEGGETLE